MVLKLRVAKTIQLEQHILLKQCQKLIPACKNLGMGPGIVIFLVRRNNATE